MRIKLIIFLFFSCFAMEASAQIIRGGFHLLGGLSRFSVPKNQLSDQLTIRSGPLFSTAGFGVQATLEGPRDQPSKHLRIKKVVLLEANFARNGGKIETTTILPSGNRTFNELTYIQYQGNYSAKIMLGLRSFQFLVGPLLTSNFYSGLEISGNDALRSAKNQFSLISLGYEAGIGVRAKSLLLSMRYRSYITDYGVETNFVPTTYQNHQFLFVLSFFILEKERAKNFDSIFWN